MLSLGAFAPYAVAVTMIAACGLVFLTITTVLQCIDKAAEIPESTANTRVDVANVVASSETVVDLPAA